MSLMIAVGSFTKQSIRQMSMKCSRLLLAASMALAVTGAHASQGSSTTTVIRMSENPLVRIDSSPTLGDNINGPTVVRVPDWVEHPLGRYYMYFAHHMGQHIRLAYADAIEGPWHVYEPGALQVRDTAFFRPQPDPPENLENFYTHVASPEIYFDTATRRVVMWFHGWYTNGEMWPVGEAAATAWAREHGYSQFSQVAVSRDGIYFEVQPAITKTSYMRLFRHDGHLYAMARLGVLLRADDPLASFEIGPNPFRNGPFAERVRHVTTLLRGSRLYVFFTAIGDAPERVMMSTIDLSGDWTGWKASDAVEVLRPERAYECVDLPIRPSLPGDVKGAVQEIRDPYIFEDGGRTYLFYSFCGEQWIAGAALTLP